MDVVIIGGGHVGLTASYFLKKAGVQHVVLEKSQIANTWHTQRWDSFNLVLPNWTLLLPEFAYAGPDPEGFLDLQSTIQYIKNFAAKFDLPIRCGVEVSLLESEGTEYIISTNLGKIQTKNVIVATGAFHKPKIPAWANLITKNIDQMHSSHYRNPSQIREGSVLVVGTGQSGAQISEELNNNGRKVFLSVSRCGGRPRRYRGKDCVWWMNQRGFYDQTFSSIPASQHRLSCNVPLTGHSGGHDINFYEFAKKGIELLGRITAAKDDCLVVADDLQSNLYFAVTEWERFLRECDLYAEAHNLDFPLEPSAYKKVEAGSVALRKQIHLTEENITQIIWATGFELSYPWINMPIFDSSGFPVHTNGITDHAGLYFLGLPWLSQRKSAIFLGTTDDARRVTDTIVSCLARS